MRTYACIHICVCVYSKIPTSDESGGQGRQLWLVDVSGELCVSVGVFFLVSYVACIVEDIASTAVACPQSCYPLSCDPGSIMRKEDECQLSRQSWSKDIFLLAPPSSWWRLRMVIMEDCGMGREFRCQVRMK